MRMIGLVALVALITPLAGCAVTKLPDGFERREIYVPFLERKLDGEYSNLYVDPETGAEHEISFKIGATTQAGAQLEALKAGLAAAAMFYGAKKGPGGAGGL